MLVKNLTDTFVMIDSDLVQRRCILSGEQSQHRCCDIWSSKRGFGTMNNCFARLGRLLGRRCRCVFARSGRHILLLGFFRAGLAGEATLSRLCKKLSATGKRAQACRLWSSNQTWGEWLLQDQGRQRDRESECRLLRERMTVRIVVDEY